MREYRCGDQGELQLLRQYVEDGCQAAFGRIVSQHSGLVYSTCLRVVGEPGLAEDATQAVFLLLARKAASLPPETILPGWLYRTACFVARDVRKMECRRRLREQKMAEEQRAEEERAQAECHGGSAHGDEPWASLAPLLDDAMASLPERDMMAVVLRFFEGRSLRETGAALGISEAAAQMRVVRSLEKLRRFFARQDVVVSVAVLAMLLWTKAVHAAPASCGTAVLLALSQRAIPPASPGALGSSLSNTPKGGWKIQHMNPIHWAATAAAILSVGLTGGVINSHVTKAHAHSPKAAAAQKPAAAGVYVCEICRCYYTPTQAKSMGYIEPGTNPVHHLVYAAKAPAGYTSAQAY